jgi:RND family efflux transporter MFP subunit
MIWDRRLLRTARPLLASAVILFGAGCDILGSAPPPIDTAPPKPTPQPARATAVVKRATIVDAIKVLGRVVSSQEADLSFRNSGRIRDVYAQPGDMVQAGQVLAELDQRDLPWLLAKARVDAERQEVKIAAAQAKAVIDDTELDALNIRASEIAVKQAEIGVERVQAGALDVDIKKAQADVTARSSDVDKAKFDLTDKTAALEGKRAELAIMEQPVDANEVAKAAADLESARIKLEQLKAGPRPEDIKAAEIALDQERTKLARVREQPLLRPEDVANARLEVDKAQVALARVLADIDAGAIKGEANRSVAVRAAQTELERAQNNVTKLQSTEPKAEDIRAQEQLVQLAEINLTKVKAIQPADIEAAQTAVAAAQARLDSVKRGSPESELNALRAQIRAMELALENSRSAIRVAESNLFAAQAKLALATQGPLEFDIRDATNKVSLATSALTAARARLETRRATIAQTRAVASFDIETLRRGLNQARLDVGNYEAQTGDVKIVAPFSGRVTRVAARPGDTVTAFMPLFNVSSLEGLVVKADISDSDLPRLSPGMNVEMVMDSYPNQVLNGVIETLPDAQVGSVGQAPDRATRIKVNWPGPGAEMGMLARVQITLLVKPDVLMVPNGAVRVVGKRKFVEYMDGEIKRSRNVETGISTESDTEIISGVQEGMVILAGQSS